MLGEPHLKCHLMQRKFNKLQFHQGELRMDGAESVEGTAEKVLVPLTDDPKSIYVHYPRADPNV